MNQHLQKIQDFIQQAETLSAEEKTALTKAVKDTDSAINITEFKLERTEKVKRTTAILLEETIEELEQKRKAIEDKNHELEIEAAMEKVRTRTMAMRHSNELADSASVLFEQIKELGFEMWSCGFCIWKSNDLSEVWMAADSGGLLPPMLIPYKEEPTHHKIYEASLQGETSHEKIWEGDELAKHYEFLRTIPSVKEAIAVLENSGLALPSKQCYYAGFFNQGYLLLITKEPRDGAIDLSKRFASVFEQTYTRFLDLQKAETQARESQIELALERVRARTMAMQHSDELAETAYILFQQFKELGENPDQATIGIINEEAHVIEYWVTMYGSQVNQVFKFSIDEPNVTHKIYQGWKTKKKSLVIDLSGKALCDFTTYRANMGGAAFNPDEKRRVINVAFFSKGIINVQSTEARSAESVKLLERFAGVFDGTYTRFLDLKKAEAQARESQIQLALERVRARTMAMQHSNELPETANLLFKQVQELGMPAWSAGYCNWADHKKAITLWMSSEGVLQPPFSTPTTKDPSFIHMREAAERGETFYVEEVGGKALAKHYEYMRTLPVVGDVLDSIIEAGHPLPNFQIFHLAYFSHGFLLFITYQPVPEAHSIFKRFAKVFEQTYTRFLDLQKAEAQVREARIEAALERTRTQSMLMQHSTELDDTLRVFHQQVLLLGIHSAFSFLWLPDEEKDRHIFWAAWAENNINDFKSKAIDYPLDRTEPATEQCLVDWKGNDPVVSYHVPPEGVKGYFAAWHALIVGVEQLKPEHFKGGLYYAEAFMKYGCFGVMVENSLSPEETKILGRFAIEFERTYTRFLDLQKAEAQAREAQIELALERVRARTMAMYHSEELAETASVLFEQLSELGSEPARISIGIMDQEKGVVHFWATDQEGDRINISFTAPVSEKTTISKMYAGWQAKLKSLSIELEGKELAEWVRFCREGMGIIIRDELLQKRRVHTVGYFSQGWINYTTHTPPSSETTQILERFATMFSYTYTRFLDLQKAEAQARESQIELALERVRARTMAMQKSEELKEIIKVVYEQLVHLNILAEHAGFIMDYRANDDMHIWLADKHFDPSRVTIPYFDSPHWNSFNEAKEKGIDFFANHLTFEEKNKFYRDLFEIVPGVTDESRDYYFNCPGLAASTVLLETVGLYIENFSGIPYTDEENSTLIRFGKVFQQTYTRFNDLKQAEAQARESKIEAALEKVRSSSLAMHQSAELLEIVSVVFEKLQELEVPVTSAGIHIAVEGSEDADIYVCGRNENGLVVSSYRLPYFDHPIECDLVRGWDEGLEFLSKTYTAKEKNSFYKYLFKHSDLEYLPADIKDLILQSKSYTLSMAFAKHSMIVINDFEGKSLSDKEIDILKRFAKVFEQAYIRFLDLKKAEAQSREAQVELSLERIRAKTMAMHNSEDVSDTVITLFAELMKLGVETTIRCGVAIIDNIKQMEVWTASSNETGDAKLDKGFLDMTIHPLLQGIFKGWRNKQQSVAYELTGKDLVAYYQGIIDSPDYAYKPDIRSLPGKQINNAFFFPEGALFAFTLEPLSTEATKLFIRFASVFGLTYRRFLDLQKAEEQAREAQIEAALEKVRSASLAMHKSGDLRDVVKVVFERLQYLGFGIDGAAFIVTPIENSKDINTWIGDDHAEYPNCFRTPFYDAPVYLDIWKARESGSEFFSATYSFAEKTPWFSYIFEHSDYKHLPGELKSWILEQEYLTQCFAMTKNSGVGIHFHYQRTLSENEIDILKRFAKVFDQAYVRFLDLQKAEAQAREAQIEAALERVRSRTMGMQKSEELSQVIQLIFEQMQHLNFNIDTVNFTLNYKESDDLDLWIAVAGARYATKICVPYFDHPMFVRFNEAKASGLYVDSLTLQEKNSFFEHFFKYAPEVTAERRALVFGQPGFARSAAFMKNIALTIINYKGTPFSEIENSVLLRFGQVFDQTYTRFKDLEQAEEQAREAQIQLALERVRAKAMAMYHSEELNDVLSVLIEQFDILGIHPVKAVLSLFDTEKRTLTFRTTGRAGQRIIGEQIFDIDSTETFKMVFETWQSEGSGSVFRSCIPPEILPQVWALFPDAFAKMPEEAWVYPTDYPDGLYNTFAWCKFGYIGFDNTRAATQEEENIAVRFANEFERLYQRFLDLQKAETQAREAKIEASLEKVRSKAMAMHNSDDLSSATSLVFTELKKLGITAIRCGVGLFSKESPRSQLYSATISKDSDTLALIGWIEMVGHPVLAKIYNGWLNQEDYFPVLNGRELKSFYKKISPGMNMASIPGAGSDEKQYGHFLYFTEGALNTWAERPYSEPELKVLDRFKSIISLTFRRYLDLKKAEDQAREAKIEAALERIRSRTMAMQHSTELQDAFLLLFQQSEILGIKAFACGFNIWDDDRRFATAWMGSVQGIQHPFKTDSTKDIYLPIYEAAQRGEALFVREQSGTELKVHYDYLATIPIFKDMVNLTRAGFDIPSFQIIHCAFFAQGYLVFISYEPCPDAYDIFKRFAKVFEQTYTRFLDLQRAEIQAREALKQASVDRVRGEIASMRSTDDLARITPLIWNELTILGIPFIRCGVFIVDEEAELIHTHLSTSAGTALATFDLRFDSGGIGQNVLPAWRIKQIATVHWSAEDFAGYTKNLVEQGTVKLTEKYVTEHPDTSLDLHFFPFLQGMLYVGNSEPLSNDSKDLVQSLADAFSTAYARYEDFNKLEVAKQQVDKTLTDLKAAQTQLIQTEKMASLGELTAGIAHEIQNPLNFVNNFSEVNAELIEEMQEEIEKGDLHEIKALALDIAENSKKISIHGKRADGIVKGMLQHSQSGSGIKELTNINSVADEYMRLAYHGLRAKDKSFNAEMTTAFDPGLPKINVIGQDIGRVMLNLFNNAFYAVNKKRQKLIVDYKPEITATTSVQNGQVIIKIKDNGIGMPDDIKEKIMQPFFTTKPTGEGTGLGLSLTYDMVVKGHGGSIEVNSVEDEGSEFIVKLPLS